jgi:hypothetical protein
LRIGPIRNAPLMTRNLNRATAINGVRLGGQGIKA